MLTYQLRCLDAPSAEPSIAMYNEQQQPTVVKKTNQGGKLRTKLNKEGWTQRQHAHLQNSLAQLPKLRGVIRNAIAGVVTV